jgi:nucleotide-binding universal stress UspA family protein
MFRKILVAHDGSEGARKAMTVAIDLARHYGAEIQIISVIEAFPKYAGTIDEVEAVQAEALQHYQAIQAEACQQAAQQGVKASDKVLPGHEVDTIVHYAEEQHCDVLIVGRQGHSARWLKHLGSTSSQVTFYAPCTVMVVA